MLLVSVTLSHSAVARGQNKLVAAWLLCWPSKLAQYFFAAGFCGGKKKALFCLSGKVVVSCDLPFLPWRTGFRLLQQLQSENCRRVCRRQQFCLNGSRAEAAKGDRDNCVRVIPGQVLLWGWAARLYTLGAVSERSRAWVVCPGFASAWQHLWVEAGGLQGQSMVAEVSCLFIAALQQWLCVQVGHRVGEAPEAGQQGSCWPLPFPQDWGWKAVLTRCCLFSQSRHQRQLPCSRQSTKQGNKG